MRTALSYQDALRVLATLLEQCQDKRATLRVSPQGALAAAPGWRWPSEWTPDMLRDEAARQARDRTQPRYEHLRSDRLSACLRVLGSDLDEQGVGFFVLTVLPEAIHVQVQGGDEQTIDMESLKRRARRFAGRREQPAAADGPARP
ncbi:MAG TPA: hypothetical protein VII06_10845 [Chloroflexota bacterium]|jgi:hypothetical protein